MSTDPLLSELHNSEDFCSIIFGPQKKACFPTSSPSDMPDLTCQLRCNFPARPCASLIFPKTLFHSPAGTYSHTRLDQDDVAYAEAKLPQTTTTTTTTSTTLPQRGIDTIDGRAAIPNDC